MSLATSIRRLRPADAQDYRALMLEAYERHPAAFTSSAEERGALPLSWWEARLAEAPDAPDLVLGGFAGATLAGAAGMSFETRVKARHKATLFGMYVQPAFRQLGLGAQLVAAALASARERDGVGLVQLTVTSGNRNAQALYERAGFLPFGIEPYAVAVAGGYVSKVHMWYNLGLDPAHSLA